MIEDKRFVDYFDKEYCYIIQDLENEDEYQVGFVNCDEEDFLELVNGLDGTVKDLSRDYQKLMEENEQLKSLIQELRNELRFDEKQYKVFMEVIDEADDLIKSHLSKYYQRKWKNFCKSREIEL